MIQKPPENGDKVIGRRDFGALRTLRGSLVNNWCLKRSRLIYAIASRCLPGEVRIHIAMRCRDTAELDWGHAWVTYNGHAVWERHRAILNKDKTLLADTGKYVYWIFK